MSRIRAEYMDPAGVRHGGMPTVHWGGADPTIYATKRQLAKKGKRRGRQPVAAQLRWWGITGHGGYGERFADLYRWDLAKDKRPATRRQLAALAKANRALRTCPTCGVVREYVIPRKYGECIDCHDDYWCSKPYSGAEREAA
ncbi:RRQRL motif-containing zinc-binding protein [Cryptosporangium aurantiacum]|uniref:Uncharacterized protein n=1 Tax=Cryptosporangium aurantiacum TaxID=134849 RepID=A0A1M7NMP9_9ACTN|nr:RRQRL motif-containing zinc-binding protein [Cryptosporangium aurantiacum]SHN05050.1 hypothetical protein SAMN05443668_102724 [Cryptosporangium aurantiacum]